jgi:uncharacterized protein YqeY
MLRETLQNSLKQAMHARDEISVGTLRLINAAIKDRDIAARTKGNWDGIADEDIFSLLQTMIKQRQESIRLYEQGNRPELAAQEQAEIKVIETFLPRQMSEDEVKAIIEDTIAKTGAASIKDMGKVIAAIKQAYAGQLDVGRMSAQVKDRLNASS